MEKNLDLGYDKKGRSVIDVITVVIVLVVFMLVTIGVKLAFNEINTDFQADADIDTQAKTTMQEQHSRFSNVFDGLFIFGFILLWGLMIGAAFVIDAHPYFFIFTVILMIFVFIIAADLGNSYEEITDDPSISTVAAEFTMANWIMSHLLPIIIVVAFSVMIVLFGKNRFMQ